MPMRNNDEFQEYGNDQVPERQMDAAVALGWEKQRGPNDAGKQALTPILRQDTRVGHAKRTVAAKTSTSSWSPTALQVQYKGTVQSPPTHQGNSNEACLSPKSRVGKESFPRENEAPSPSQSQARRLNLHFPCDMGFPQFEADIDVAPGLVAQGSLKKKVQNISRRIFHRKCHRDYHRGKKICQRSGYNFFLII